MVHCVVLALEKKEWLLYWKVWPFFRDAGYIMEEYICISCTHTKCTGFRCFYSSCLYQGPNTNGRHFSKCFLIMSNIVKSFCYFFGTFLNDHENQTINHRILGHPSSVGDRAILQHSLSLWLWRPPASFTETNKSCSRAGWMVKHPSDVGEEPVRAF